MHLHTNTPLVCMIAQAGTGEAGDAPSGGCGQAATRRPTPLRDGPSRPSRLRVPCARSNPYQSQPPLPCHHSMLSKMRSSRAQPITVVAKRQTWLQGGRGTRAAGGSYSKSGEGSPTGQRRKPHRQASRGFRGTCLGKDVQPVALRQARLGRAHARLRQARAALHRQHLPRMPAHNIQTQTLPKEARSTHQLQAPAASCIGCAVWLIGQASALGRALPARKKAAAARVRKQRSVAHSVQRSEAGRPSAPGGRSAETTKGSSSAATWLDTVISACVRAHPPR